MLRLHAVSKGGLGQAAVCICIFLSASDKAVGFLSCSTGVERGSGKPNKDIVGQVTKAQVEVRSRRGNVTEGCHGGQLALQGVTWLGSKSGTSPVMSIAR